MVRTAADRARLSGALTCFAVTVSMDFVEGIEDGYAWLVEHIDWDNETVRHVSKSIEVFIDMLGMTLFPATFLGQIAHQGRDILIRLNEGIRSARAGPGVLLAARAPHKIMYQKSQNIVGGAPRADISRRGRRIKIMYQKLQNTVGGAPRADISRRGRRIKIMYQKSQNIVGGAPRADISRRGRRSYMLSIPNGGFPT